MRRAHILFRYICTSIIYIFIFPVAILAHCFCSRRRFRGLLVMAAGEDFFAACGAAGLPDGPGDFFPDPPEPAELRPRSGGHGGRPREPPGCGTVGCWIVTAEAGDVAPRSGDARRGGARFDARHVEGLGVLTWKYEALCVDELTDGARGPVSGIPVDRTHWGEIRWTLEDVWLLGRPHPIPDDVDLGAQSVGTTLEFHCGMLELPDVKAAVTEFTKSSDHQFRTALVLPTDLAQTALASEPPCALRSVKLGARVDPSQFICNLPPHSFVKSWRRKAQAQHAPRPARDEVAEELTPGEKLLLELPAKRRKPDGSSDSVFDPSLVDSKQDSLRIINACAAASHLRQVERFGEAMLDAKRYEENDFDGHIVRDASQDPGKSTLLRSAKRLDLVGMALERRIWAQEVADNEVEACVVYSDASPVTGEEIQGMIVDVCKRNGKTRRVILPGATIFFSMQDAIMKVIAFVWAAWLLFGPDLFHFEFFINSCVCWCTDGGVEVHGIEVPDCMHAFLKWLGGTPLSDCAVLVR